jgi:hypothetical protein
MLGQHTAQLEGVVGREQQLGRRVARSPGGLKKNFVHLCTFPNVSNTGITDNFHLAVFKDVSVIV